MARKLEDKKFRISYQMAEEMNLALKIEVLFSDNSINMFWIYVQYICSNHYKN